MTADHLGPDVPIVNTTCFLPDTASGWDRGAARCRHGAHARTPGEYFWGGLAGTAFWIAPKEELVAIMIIQGPGQRDHFRQLFRNLVYAALV